jgi:hypothetical protein
MAQSNYREGLIVTDKGDTLKGFINYKEWYQNPESIGFKKSLSEKNAQVFSVGNTAWFSVSGYESYARYTVSISMNSINYQDLKEEADSTTVTKSVFLKELLLGDKVNLYSYKDVVKKRFYILDRSKSSTPQELLYKKTLKGLEQKTDEVFKQQLATLAIQHGIFSAKLDAAIQATHYTSNELERMISKFNSKIETHKTLQSGKKARRFFVGAGVNSFKLTHTGESLVTVDGMTSTGSDKFKDEVLTQNILPRFSSGVDFYLNPAIRRVAIRAEIAAAQMKSTTKSIYKYNIATEQEDKNTYHLSAWNFSIIPQLIFNFYNADKFKCYAGIGGAFNYLHIVDNSVTKEPLHQQNGEVKTEHNYLHYQKNNLSALIRLGVQVNQRFDFSFHFENPKELTSSDSKGDLKGRSFGVYAAYFLNK